MIKTSDIDFTRIDANKFEEICCKLIRKMGFEHIIRRKGSADYGRDIEASMLVENNLVGNYYEKWFFECKNYEKGVPAEKLESKFVWADSKKPKHLVFIISSHITNSAREYIEAKKKLVDYQVHLVEGDQLRQTLLNNLELVIEFDLLKNTSNPIDLITRKWVINNVLPDLNLVSASLKFLDYSVLNLNQILLLIGLYKINQEEKERSEYRDNGFGPIEYGEDQDGVYNLIEKGVNIYFKTNKDEIPFSSEIWQKIKWLKKKEDYKVLIDLYSLKNTPFIVANQVVMNDKKGIFGILVSGTIEANNYFDGGLVKIKPFFVEQNLKLNIINFKEISQNEAELFLESFEENRPQVPFYN